ncbi:glycoside hydrolase family 73 protein [Blattabacterium cuenoti]|uniref:glycoside hydrolase family 73 protein n=1 Tax=Blattabacterium cuenoti TaxID=1653831 RepID=UPI00163BF63D|nr:glucosaminidase domain-containing protein [Blattabacterium cuenoti]
MKNFFYLLFFLISLSFSFSKEKQKVDKEKNIEKNVIEYIRKYSILAIEEMEKFGIPASIKLGQGILESSSGNSILSKATNNHFGIKCGKNWMGDVYYYDDDLPKECFRKYNSIKDSFLDHSKFLQQPRYYKLFSLKKNDYQSWAIELKKAGYATSLNYSILLINKIEEYLLWKFDEETSKDMNKRIDLYINSIIRKNETKKRDYIFRKIRFFYKIFLLIIKKFKLYK